MIPLRQREIFTEAMQFAIDDDQSAMLLRSRFGSGMILTFNV